MVVNYKQIPNLKVDYSITGVNLNDNINNKNLSTLLNSTNIKQINYGMSISLDDNITLLKGDTDTFIGGRIIELSQNKNFLMIISLSYISIVLVIMALEILVFEFMNQLPLYKHSYKKMSIQGYNDNRLKKILKKHINSYFFATGIPTCVFAFSSIYIFSQVYWMKTYEIPLTNIKVESSFLLIIVLLLFFVIQFLLLSLLYCNLKKRLIDNH